MDTTTATTRAHDRVELWRMLATLTLIAGVLIGAFVGWTVFRECGPAPFGGGVECGMGGSTLIGTAAFALVGAAASLVPLAVAHVIEAIADQAHDE